MGTPYGTVHKPRYVPINLNLALDDSLENYNSNESMLEELHPILPDHQYPHLVHSALKTKLLSIP
jgi:hypothetical protein